MHSQEILERAREGDPRVIAAILNHVLKPLGIRTQAARREETLHIVLEANPLPEPQRLTAIVQKLLQDLHIQSLEQIVLYGQRSGEGAIAWRHDILLMAEAPENSMMNNQPYPPESHSDDSLPLILDSSETSAIPEEPEPSSADQVDLENSIFTFADIDAPLFVSSEEAVDTFPHAMEDISAPSAELEISAFPPDMKARVSLEDAEESRFSSNVQEAAVFFYETEGLHETENLALTSLESEDLLLTVEVEQSVSPPGELGDLGVNRNDAVASLGAIAPDDSPFQSTESFTESFQEREQSDFFSDDSEESDFLLEEREESLIAIDTEEPAFAPIEVRESTASFEAMDESLFSTEEPVSEEADSLLEAMDESLFAMDAEEPALSPAEARESVASFEAMDDSLFVMEETPSAEVDSPLEAMDESLFAVDTSDAGEEEAIAPLPELDESLFTMEETASAESDSPFEEIDESLFAVDTSDAGEEEAIAPLPDLDDSLFSMEEDLSSSVAELDESLFSTEEALGDRSTDLDEFFFLSEEDPDSSSTDPDESLFDVEEAEDVPLSLAELEDPIAPIAEPEEAISFGLDNLDNNDVEGVLESSLEAVNASAVVPPPLTMRSPSSEDTLLTESLEPPVSLRESEDTEDTDESLRAFIKALQRPEAVILLFALVLATLWELYLDLAEGDTEESLTGTGLAKRLQVSPSTVSRRKDQEDFSGWSQSLDPEGIAWIYRAGRFWPLEGSIVAS